MGLDWLRVKDGFPEPELQWRLFAGCGFIDQEFGASGLRDSGIRAKVLQGLVKVFLRLSGLGFRGSKGKACKLYTN